MSHPRRDGDRTLTSEAKGWPTPNAHDGRRPGVDERSTQGANLSRDSVMIWQTPSARDQEGSGFRGGDRSDEAKLGGQAKLWGTPAAHQRSHSQREVDHGIQLANQACSHMAPAPTGEQSQNTSGRRLNPAFVCWLMGAPWFWTRAEPISFGAREMQSFHFALQSRLSSLCGG